MNNLIPIGKSNKPKVIRIIAVTILIALIVGIIFLCYYGLKNEISGGEKYCYIPFCFLLLNVPLIVYIVKLCKQPAEFIFYNSEENRIYLRTNKLGIYKGFYKIDIQNINAIYTMEQYINGAKVIVLRIEFKNDKVFVSNDYFNYDAVIINLLELLPLENKNIVKMKKYK